MADNLKIGGEKGFIESDAQKAFREQELAKSANKSKGQTLASVGQTLADIQSQIPGITAGIKSLAEIDTSKAPAIGTNAGDIQATNAGIITSGTTQNQQIQTQLSEMMKNVQKQQTEGQQSTADWLKGVVGLGERPKPLDTKALTEQLLASYGQTPESFQRQQGLIGQLTEFSRQQANLEAQKQQDLLISEQSRAGGLSSLLRGEQSLIERKYNSQIAAKAAQAAVVGQQYNLERGLRQEAMNMTNMIVSAATYDQQQIVADYEWTYNAYQDMINGLKDDEKTQWDRSYTLAKDELDRQETEMTNKTNLMLEAASEGINLGWSVDYMKGKTLEELSAEVAPRISAKVDGGGYKTPTIKTINGVDYQFNPSTGQWDLPTLPEGGGGFSGKYDQGYLYQRAQDFVNEDGSIDWLSLDDLENTDKALWNDTTLFLQNVLNDTAEDEAQAQIEVSPIEKDIANLSRSGILKKSDIRATLKKRGYTDAEITSSSVGDILKKAASAVTSTLSWLWE